MLLTYLKHTQQDQGENIIHNTRRNDELAYRLIDCLSGSQCRGSHTQTALSIEKERCQRTHDISFLV